ncbi:hypothetical protein GCM10017788_59500 [Amycolatopsis acidiphila]|nr:hypothetical protein GCM10017788_59500 [Amycolatopsis acidiphila]
MSTQEPAVGVAPTESHRKARTSTLKSVLSALRCAEQHGVRRRTIVELPEAGTLAPLRSKFQPGASVIGLTQRGGA